MLFYGLFVAGAALALLIIYGLVKLIVAISNAISHGRVEKAKADLARNRVRHGSVQVQREQVKLAQEKPLPDEYAKYRRRVYMEEPPQLPRGTQKLTRQLAEPPAPESTELDRVVIPGMPDRTFRYSKYARMIQPGQLAIGGRANGSIRIGVWAEYKVLLVLGGSASGKTTTIIEKCLGAVRGGGLLIPCDPHGHKQDSLLRKIYPLKNALFPGATLAIEHVDILKNIELAKAELDKRVHGGDCSVSVTLVIEELNRLQRDKSISKAVTEILQIVGQEGRGYNVFAIVGAQQISYLSEIRKSIISFIIHRVDEAEAKLCIPARYARYAPELRVGQSIVKDADGLCEPFMQLLVTIEDIELEGAKIAPQRQQSKQFYNSVTSPIGQVEKVLPHEIPAKTAPVYGYRGRLQEPTPASEPPKPQFKRMKLVSEALPVTARPAPPQQTESFNIAVWQGPLGTTENLQKSSSLPLAPVQYEPAPAQREQVKDVVAQSQNAIAQDKLSRLAEQKKKKTTKNII